MSSLRELEREVDFLMRLCEERETAKIEADERLEGKRGRCRRLVAIARTARRRGRWWMRAAAALLLLLAVVVGWDSL